MTKLRITVACPEDMRDDANSFAMVMAEGPADAGTYGKVTMEDTQGNIYYAASFLVPVEWITAPQSTLHRPEWDDDYTVNMAGAERAQDAIVFWGGQGPIPQANPTTLTAVGGMSGPDALEAMGLFAVEA